MDEWHRGGLVNESLSGSPAGVAGRADGAMATRGPITGDFALGSRLPVYFR